MAAYIIQRLTRFKHFIATKLYRFATRLALNYATIGKPPNATVQTG